MTQDDWPVDEPITYAHEEDETEVEDEDVPDDLPLPGAPLHPDDDNPSDFIALVEE